MALITSDFCRSALIASDLMQCLPMSITHTARFNMKHFILLRQSTLEHSESCDRAVRPESSKLVAYTNKQLARIVLARYGAG